MYSYPGTWKNFDDLEENLTKEELFELLLKARELKYENMKFMAALKGIDLEKDSQKQKFDEVRSRAMARSSGVSVEQVELSVVGIAVEEGE
jgi:hypothetical protein